MVWIGILVYTDPAGLRTYLAAQVTEQSPLGEGALAPLPVPSGVLPASHRTLPFSIFPWTLPPSYPRIRHCQEPPERGPAEASMTAGPQGHLGARRRGALEETVLPPLAHALQLLQHHTGQRGGPAELSPPLPPGRVSSLPPEHPFPQEETRGFEF